MDTIHRAAGFSRCRRYRYWLTRTWEGGRGCLCWVLLNPSTADDRRDDPSIHRCVGFARALGCGSIHVVNLFAFRATRPQELQRAADPVGPRNDRFILRAARAADRVIVAWGCHGAYRDRDRRVMALLDRFGIQAACLGTTRGGRPRHPLYLPGGAVPEPFTAADLVLSRRT